MITAKMLKKAKDLNLCEPEKLETILHYVNAISSTVFAEPDRLFLSGYHTMKADEPWIIDTACSVHMTGNHDLLREIEQLTNTVEVVTALPKPNRAFSNHIGSSDILTTLDGITPKRMVLTNVMHAAGMKKW